MNESLPSTPLHILLNEGNQLGLSLLNRDYAKDLYLTIRKKYLTNDDDSHDILNQSLLLIWAQRGHFESATHVVKLWYKIAKDKAFDRLRALKREQQRFLTGLEPDELTADEQEERIPVNEAPIQRARVRLYRSAIGQLSDKQRTIVQAICLDGEPIKAVAARLELSYSTVTNTRDQALKKMRDYLYQHGITPDTVPQLVDYLTILLLLLSTFLKNI